MVGERLILFNSAGADTELPRVPHPHHRSGSRGQRNRVRVERWNWKSKKQHGLSNAVEHYSPFVPRDPIRGPGIALSRDSARTSSIRDILSEEGIQKLTEAGCD
ncbi:hypothetical protein A2165_04485 [Candidatus Curtissbacteria bacterium RBG_13_40_7]|uniref:Uncharacterized protein n=1 Tax=Candidatus Curtissbacteria bacterium RBG_13_40_7 TaxID=1797706 RepID=A0A1F5FVB8_9BACT|nr:MAG: hypothetical protein A2165_04485 [Candidatus Curtissbacteria bacterium RBG_13_40_7]